MDAPLKKRNNYLPAWNKALMVHNLLINVYLVARLRDYTVKFRIK